MGARERRRRMIQTVGQKYPQFRMDDGVFLLYGESGLRLVYVMANPSPDEIQSMKPGAELMIRMGLMENHIVWCTKPDGQPWSDCAFAPALQPDLPYDVEIQDTEGLALTVELYDGATGELLSLRLVSLSHNFSVLFLQNCRELLQCTVSLAEINASYVSIMRRSTAELVNMCDCHLKIGGNV